MERLYWTDRSSFPLEEELEPLFNEALSRGYRPYRDVFDGHVESGGFGICGGPRQAFYIRRGRGRKEMHGTLWEVLLYDAETCFRLGPYFGLPEHSCIVVRGAEAVSFVNDCWLEGGEIAAVINAAEFFNRRNMDTLKPPDASFTE